ncbi:MAG: GNAT family N-acetyltransferase [Acetatifactor sp.]
MINELIIRKENPEDYKKTELMTMRSFWNKFGPGCSEHNMIRIIRASADYLPEISRIAEYNGKIVGAVYYTKAWIVDGENKNEVAMLGPLAVEPTFEGNGIGGALLRETTELAKKAGVNGIILAGESGYYPKYGFKKCELYGITDGDGNCYDAYMCYPISEEFDSMSGHFVESADFEKIEDPALLEAIEKEFPLYRKVKVQDGFMQINNQHLGVVETVHDDIYQVRYWDLLITARLSEGLYEKPSVRSDVLFYWNHKGDSCITKVFKNMLDE